jgi:acetate kinase
MMGTRCGDVDPAILPYLSKQAGMSLDDLDTMLNRKSGLLGIAGMNDMRDLHAACDKGDENAKLALEMFCYSIRKYIGAYYAALGRIDALVFTAGIGENDDLARALICADLDDMGITIDPALNTPRSSQAREISRKDGKVRVLVIPTNEELAIAESTMKVLGL